MAYGSTIWNKTTSGRWVPDAYVKTGTTGFAPGVPRCDDVSKDAHSYAATTTLNARNAPNLSATVVHENAYRTGVMVPVVCQATGGAAYGSSIWDKTADGTWVPDAYVKTGYTGFSPDLPRCVTTAAPTKFRYKAKTDLNGRSSTVVAAPAVKVYKGGSVVTITCQAIGENAYGSNIWDKTTDGLWVPDKYLKTGFDTFVPGVPRCADNTSATGKSFVTTAALSGRTAKSVTATSTKTYASGATIKVTCQAYGGYAYGSYIWDKTSDNLWVSDYYVRTGTTGFVSNMPRCDNDLPTGGTPGGDSPVTGGRCDLVGHGERNGPAGLTTGTTSEKVARVIAAAKSQTGKGLSYSWGGGGKSGPTCGIASPSPHGHIDYNILGFDCSGLMQYAFWAGAGVDVGGTSKVQSLRATRIPYSSARPGDMIFWGAPGQTWHVALLIGNGQMIEAAPPRNTTSVHVTNIYGSHSYAVRIFS
jgi:hypothetical protein